MKASTKLLILVIMLCATMAWAGPARDVVIKHIQPDGTELSLHLVGDEYMHYYVNLADGQKMRQEDDGHFYPITESTAQEMLRNANTQRQDAQQRRAKRISQIRNISKKDAPKKVRTGDFHKEKGSKKGLVILVNFADLSINENHTQTSFYNKFNLKGYKEDGHIGSVKDYFEDQSYGIFSIDFDIVGPITLSKEMSYYGENDDYGNDKAVGSMAKEACIAVDDKINFSDYDWDGDNEVDLVFIIYAGYGEQYGANANTIWTSAGTLSDQLQYGDTGAGALSLDGVKIDIFACASELAFSTGTELDGIGGACHEFSHCLGFPDLYDTDFSGAIGMASYDLMCDGQYNGPKWKGEVPAGYSVYERWMAGWLEPEILNESSTILNMPDLGSAPSAYIIYNSNNANEYFLLENRQNKKWFRYYNADISGHGLFITHIDYDAKTWSFNKPNDDPQHQRVSWVPADKNYQNGVTNDFFPGTSGITSFNPSQWSTAGGKWYTKENEDLYSPHTLSEITEDASTGTISFNFDGREQRYSITYNAGEGYCSMNNWTQSSKNQNAILPSATIDSREWSFVGWSTSEVTETSTVPTFFHAGDLYTPQKDQTLYAVYLKTAEEGVQGWQTVSDLNTLSDGIYAICTPEGYAFNGTIYHGSGGLTKEKFTFNNDGIAETAPNGICEITISASNGHFSMYNSEKGYLYIAKADYGCLNWSNAKVSKWKIDNSNWAYQIRKDAYAYLKSNSDPKIVSASQVTKNSVIFVQKLTSQTTLYATNPSLK